MAEFIRKKILDVLIDFGFERRRDVDFDKLGEDVLDYITQYEAVNTSLLTNDLDVFLKSSGEFWPTLFLRGWLRQDEVLRGKLKFLLRFFVSRFSNTGFKIPVQYARFVVCTLVAKDERFLQGTKRPADFRSWVESQDQFRDYSDYFGSFQDYLRDKKLADTKLISLFQVYPTPKEARSPSNDPSSKVYPIPKGALSPNNSPSSKNDSYTSNGINRSSLKRKFISSENDTSSDSEDDEENSKKTYSESPQQKLTIEEMETTSLCSDGRGSRGSYRVEETETRSLDGISAQPKSKNSEMDKSSPGAERLSFSVLIEEIEPATSKKDSTAVSEQIENETSKSDSSGKNVGNTSKDGSCISLEESGSMSPCSDESYHFIPSCSNTPQGNSTKKRQSSTPACVINELTAVAEQRARDSPVRKFRKSSQTSIPVDVNVSEKPTGSVSADGTKTPTRKSKRFSASNNDEVEAKASVNEEAASNNSVANESATNDVPVKVISDASADKEKKSPVLRRSSRSRVLKSVNDSELRISKSLKSLGINEAPNSSGEVENILVDLQEDLDALPSDSASLKQDTPSKKTRNKQDVLNSSDKKKIETDLGHLSDLVFKKGVPEDYNIFSQDIRYLNRLSGGDVAVKDDNWYFDVSRMRPKVMLTDVDLKSSPPSAEKSGADTRSSRKRFTSVTQTASDSFKMNLRRRCQSETPKRNDADLNPRLRRLTALKETKSRSGSLPSPGPLQSVSESDSEKGAEHEPYVIDNSSDEDAMFEVPAEVPFLSTSNKSNDDASSTPSRSQGFTPDSNCRSARRSSTNKRNSVVESPFPSPERSLTLPPSPAVSPIKSASRAFHDMSSGTTPRLSLRNRLLFKHEYSISGSDEGGTASPERPSSRSRYRKLSFNTPDAEKQSGKMTGIVALSSTDDEVSDVEEVPSSSQMSKRCRPVSANGSVAKRFSANASAKSVGSPSTSRSSKKRQPASHNSTDSQAESDKESVSEGDEDVTVSKLCSRNAKRSTISANGSVKKVGSPVTSRSSKKRQPAPHKSSDSGDINSQTDSDKESVLSGDEDVAVSKSSAQKGKRNTSASANGSVKKAGSSVAGRTSKRSQPAPINSGDSADSDKELVSDREEDVSISKLSKAAKSLSLRTPPRTPKSPPKFTESALKRSAKSVSLKTPMRTPKSPPKPSESGLRRSARIRSKKVDDKESV